MQFLRSRFYAAFVALVVGCLVASVLVVAFRDTSARQALAAPDAAPPANDNFPAALTVGRDDTGQRVDQLPWESRVSTLGATVETGETAPCGDIGASVWYQFSPQTAGRLEVTTAGSSFDTILAVYTPGGGFLPSPPGANLVPVACNDDAGAQTSFLSLPMTQYASYFIQVGGKHGATGDLSVRFACNPSCPPPNDASAAATYASVNIYSPRQTFTGDTRAATTEPGEPRSCGNIGATVWFQISADQTEKIVLDSAGSSFDTVLATYVYGANFPTSPPAGFTPLACNNSANGTQARIAFEARAGNTYWVQAGGADGASGDLVLTVTCDPLCPPPNDGFAHTGTVLPPIQDSVSTAAATLEDGEPRPCGSIGASVWYTLYVTGNVMVNATTEGSDFDTVIAAYDGPFNESGFSSLHNLGCNDNSGGAQSRISFKGTSDRRFFVQVGGHAGATGHLKVHIDCDPSPCPPQNDGSTSAQYIDVGQLPFSNVEDTRGATVEQGEKLACGQMSHTAWFTVHAASAATVSFDSSASDFDTALAVYTTSSLALSPPQGDLQQIGCGVSAGGRRAQLFQLEANSTVYVQAGSLNGGPGGMLALNISCVTVCPPPNDNGADALFVYPSNWENDVDTTGATLEPGEPPACGDIGATVWYRIHAVADGRVRVTTEGTAFRSVLAAYETSAIPPLGPTSRLGCAAGGPTLEFDVRAGKDYFVQAGGVKGASGLLKFHLACLSGCVDIPPPAGNVIAGAAGSITLPNTGSGGYLPGARR